VYEFFLVSIASPLHHKRPEVTSGKRQAELNAYTTKSLSITSTFRRSDLDKGRPVRNRPSLTTDAPSELALPLSPEPWYSLNLFNNDFSEFS